MSKYTRTTISISVHPSNVNPLFGEGATHVSLDDEGGGPYIVLRQCEDDSKVGEIRVDYEELTQIWQVAEVLLAGWPEGEE